MKNDFKETIKNQVQEVINLSHSLQFKVKMIQLELEIKSKNKKSKWVPLEKV